MLIEPLYLKHRKGVLPYRGMNMTTVGYDNSLVKFLQKDTEKIAVDVIAKNYFEKFYKKEYGIIQPTAANVTKNIYLANVDKPNIADFTQKQKDNMDKAYEWTKRILQQYNWSWKENTSISDIEYNRQSSTGPGYDSFPNMGAYVDTQQEEIQDWVERAHLFQYPVIWAFTGKKELIKLKKINENNIRIFMNSQAPYRVSSMFWFQPMCKKFYDISRNHPDSPFMPGKSFKGGGFRDLKRFLADCEIYFAGDCVKWDKNISAFLIMIYAKLLLEFYVGDNPDIKDVVRYYAIEAPCYNYAVNVTGVIYQMHGHNVYSGRVDTTVLNTIIHLFVWCFIYIENINDDFDQFRREVKIKFYSDDHAGGLNGESVLLASFEVRAKSYSVFGIKLDKTKDFVSSSINGITFLGFEIVEGRPIPDFVKCVNAIVIPETTNYYTAYIDAYSRAVSFLIDNYYSPNYSLFEGWAMNCYSRVDKGLGLPSPHPRSEIGRIWTADEGPFKMAQVWQAYNPGADINPAHTRANEPYGRGRTPTNPLEAAFAAADYISDSKNNARMRFGQQKIGPSQNGLSPFQALEEGANDIYQYQKAGRDEFINQVGGRPNNYGKLPNYVEGDVPLPLRPLVVPKPSPPPGPKPVPTPTPGPKPGPTPTPQPGPTPGPVPVPNPPKYADMYWKDDIDEAFKHSDINDVKADVLKSAKELEVSKENIISVPLNEGYTRFKELFKWGNYCGLNYGDPSYKQESVDILDDLCKMHDKMYDMGKEEQADRLFIKAIKENSAKMGWREYGAAMFALTFFSAKLSTKQKDFAVATVDVVEHDEKFVDFINTKLDNFRAPNKQRLLLKMPTYKKRKPKTMKKKNGGGKNNKRWNAIKPRRNRKQARQPKIPQMVTPPALISRVPSKSPKSIQRSVDIRTSFLISSFTTATTTVGQVLLQEPIHPGRYMNQISAVMCSFYQFYKVKGMRVEVRALNPTNTPGTYIVGIIDDPTISLMSGETLIQQLKNLNHVSENSNFVSTQLVWNGKGGTTNKYFTRQTATDALNRRLTIACNLVIAAGGACAVSSSYEIYLHMDWQFIAPITQPLDSFAIDFQTSATLISAIFTGFIPTYAPTSTLATYFGVSFPTNATMKIDQTGIYELWWQANGATLAALNSVLSGGPQFTITKNMEVFTATTWMAHFTIVATGTGTITYTNVGTGSITPGTLTGDVVKHPTGLYPTLPSPNNDVLMKVDQKAMAMQKQIDDLTAVLREMNPYAKIGSIKGTKTPNEIDFN